MSYFGPDLSSLGLAQNETSWVLTLLAGLVFLIWTCLHRWICLAVWLPTGLWSSRGHIWQNMHPLRRQGLCGNLCWGPTVLLWWLWHGVSIMTWALRGVPNCGALMFHWPQTYCKSTPHTVQVKWIKLWIILACLWFQMFWGLSRCCLDVLEEERAGDRGSLWFRSR